MLNARLKSVRNIEKITKVGPGAGLWENEAGWGMRDGGKERGMRMSMCTKDRRRRTLDCDATEWADGRMSALALAGRAGEFEEDGDGRTEEWIADL